MLPIRVEPRLMLAGCDPPCTIPLTIPTPVENPWTRRRAALRSGTASNRGKCHLRTRHLPAVIEISG